MNWFGFRVQVGQFEKRDGGDICGKEVDTMHTTTLRIVDEEGKKTDSLKIVRERSGVVIRYQQ